MRPNIIETDEEKSLLWFETPNSEAEIDLRHVETEEYKNRLDLLYEVGKKVGSVSQLTRLVERITLMTQRTLNASASSVLLSDDQKRELYFEVAGGQGGETIEKSKAKRPSWHCWLGRTSR